MRNTYVVQDGDALGKIALKFKVSISELVKLNNLKSENEIIKVGQVLKIPLTANAKPEVKNDGQTTKDKTEKIKNSTVDE